MRTRISPFLAVVLGVLCLSTPATADPRGDAHDAGKRTARVEAILETATARARDAARRLETATAALPAARDKVATSKGVVVAARVAARSARRRADAARTAYDLVVGRFEAAQQRVALARQRVDDIASASYMGAGIGALTMLASSTGPRDAMDRLGMVDQVMQRQQQSVLEMTAARRAVRVEQDNAGLARRTAEAAEQDAAAKLAVARTAQDAAEKARVAVVELAQSRQQALADANSQRSAVLAEYEEARAQEARIEAALRAWEQRGGTPGAVSGTLLMPVLGAWKSSDFGERYDPYYKVWQLHAGTDFAASAGSPIRAAASGRVIRAGWSGGYGNYTCIGHGMLRGQYFSTCYGHQSEIGVRVGEYVSRGDIIGLVGTTGASTGNHLHFETRFNGVPRDPLPFLPACFC